MTGDSIKSMYLHSLILMRRDIKETRNLIFTPADVEVEEGYVEVVEGGREAAQSSEEALSVAKFHTCPACLGRGLCQVKDHNKLPVTQFVTGNFIIILANLYHSGGEPRLVDSVRIWATCAWRH